MKKNPKNRFASMETFADALEECLKPAEPGRRQTVAVPGPHVPARRRTIRLIGVAGAAVALGAALWWMWPRSALPGGGVVSPPPSSPAAIERTADAFQAGSEWDGTFRFVPLKEGSDGDVKVVVAERTGDSFRGVYTTQEGDYQWAIEGTVKGGKASWDFVRVIREKEPQHVVGKASVEARYGGDKMEGVYQDGDSTALMTLRLKK